MCKKYELTSEIKKIKHALTRNIINLYRIKALKDFDDIKAGSLGGFIEKEVNLSHDGNCWVYDEACVYGHARVYDDAKIRHFSQVCGQVYGNAKISYCATIWGRAYGNAKINKKSKVRLVPKNCEVYEGDKLVNITDKTE
ncbi:Uncharacterised protein [Bartonella grahamii]|uniref:Phage related protein n=1 Tax=Bartonella grahamii TaxID=33045 RepID=A0A336NA93_BARGR|nr:hypothetical protein [Bartonella grahamii]SSZ38975.1 Uncharacterised protein [Bartonella grahamii]